MPIARAIWFRVSPCGRGVDLRNGVALSVGEYIFEPFYEPIDDESYDCENDSGADKQYGIRRKNEHSFFPFGFDVICSVSLRKEATDSQECTSKNAQCQEVFGKFLGGCFWEVLGKIKKLDIFEIIY